MWIAINEPVSKVRLLGWRMWVFIKQYIYVQSPLPYYAPGGASRGEPAREFASQRENSEASLEEGGRLPPSIDKLV